MILALFRASRGIFTIKTTVYLGLQYSVLIHVLVQKFPGAGCILAYMSKDPKIQSFFTCPNCKQFITRYTDGREVGHLSWCSF